MYGKIVITTENATEIADRFLALLKDKLVQYDVVAVFFDPPSISVRSGFHRPVYWTPNFTAYITDATITASPVGNGVKVSYDLRFTIFFWYCLFASVFVLATIGLATSSPCFGLALTSLVWLIFALVCVVTRWQFHRLLWRVARSAKAGEPPDAKVRFHG